MFVYKVFSRVSRTICRSSTLLSASQRSHHSYSFSNHFHSLVSPSPNKLILVQDNLLPPLKSSSSTPGIGFSSSASPETTEKEKGNNVHNGESTNDDQAKTSGEAKKIDEAGQAKAIDQTEESDSDSESECDLSRDDLIKLIAEKEELLKLKHKEIEKMQDQVLRTHAEMENVMDRSRREAENSKKIAIQNFAKSLLHVADGSGRASHVANERFSEIEPSDNSAEAVKLMKTLVEGVEMIEKQLSEVLKKFGVEKFDPTNEPIDPHRHKVVFHSTDCSKPPGTVASVWKAGYMLHGRVIRPAEVGVKHVIRVNI